MPNIVNKIRLGYAPLSKKIMLYRHGKDARVALEKRDAERDVMEVLVQFMMDDSPKGSTMEFGIGDQKYRLTLEPIQEFEPPMGEVGEEEEEEITNVIVGDLEFPRDAGCQR